MTVDLQRVYEITVQPEGHPTWRRRWRYWIDVVYSRDGQEIRRFPFTVGWAFTADRADRKARTWLDEMDEWDRAEDGSRKLAVVTHRRPADRTEIQQ